MSASCCNEQGEIHEGSRPTIANKEDEMRRLVLLCFLLGPLLALGQKPTITILTFTGSILAPTAPFCGFDMIDSAEPGRPSAERLIQFANGGALIGGPNFVQLKNANTGQIIDLNSSGPATSITIEPDGSTVVIGGGPSIFNFPPPPLEVSQAAGLPPVPYIKGRVRVVTDANGNITSMELMGGTAENICSLF
jgi:hypothetical protein